MNDTPAPLEPLSTRRLLELMRDLQRLATRRSEAEQQIAEAFELGASAATAAYQDRTAQAERDYGQARAAAEGAAASEGQRLDAEYEAARDAAQSEYQQMRSSAQAERARVNADLQLRQREESMVIRSTFDSQKDQPRRKFEEFAAGLSNQRQELTVLENDALTIFKMRRLTAPPIEAPIAEAVAIAVPRDVDSSEIRAADSLDDGSDSADPLVEQAAAEATEAIAAARGAAEALYAQRAARLLEGPTPFWITAGVMAAAAAVAGLATGWSIGATVGGALVGAAAGLAGLGLLVRPAAQKHSVAAFEGFQLHASAAAAAITSAGQIAERRSRREARELVERRDGDLEALNTTLEEILTEMQTRTREQLKTASEVFPARISKLREEYEAATAAVENELRGRIGEVTTERDRELVAARGAEAAEQQRAEQRREEQFVAMRDEWFAGVDRVAAQLAAIRDRCGRLFPDWRTTDYAAWSKPPEVSMGVEFGRATLDLATVKAGLSSDPRLRPDQTRFELPAMITLAEQPSMVITAGGAGRKRATELMQAVMLRWITGQPPGKVRFTVLDAVGLGEGFNSFMHLADYEEQLIASRIWSESRDIEEQLARLTQHMETVLQKYLRSEYETIHEYNAQAGEVAEPFQVLVINGFPHGFNDDTARRLMSLVTNGPRCGVYVVMSIDEKQRLSNDFPMDDLLGDAVHLEWVAEQGAKGAGRFVWRYPAFGLLPLELCEAPEPERMVGLLKQVGQAAKEAVRVEVPFEVVAPEADAMWTKSCADELRVAVGRSGANRLQEVRLGRGTSQHLLVAGKTGSGKSTFLHALVTSAAMHYSPDEVEFYLVDFKKGVEFKSYATNELPHARVIAVESEREFGLSVLERLDEELSRRGELYRASGVQNLADYREAHPGEAMPRVLLIIDEFQELFVEDDKLAQDATLLMDRLVRQGRAFGMHVVLGTQTLAGAYSIARSTLGQIAVRVALECSEADSHLILSDERNTAARFLSRPGEAIYNDQNGLLSANELFQVVWLPDRERAVRLADVNDRRRAVGLEPPPTIVFEGNAAADPAENEALRSRIAPPAAAHHAAPRDRQSAFLGDAVAIKPPTTVQFGRHGGSNLLVVGPDDRSALGMLSVAAISLAAGDPSARFVVLDASRPGDESEGVWQRVAGVLPPATKVADARGAAGAIAEVAAEVARREAESDDTAPPVYLVIYNAGRFRDLRKSEDDFSFSMDKDKPASPDKQLAEILKSGPGVGVHALVWCDSYNAASRLFDRMALREFALRVVLQMSAADSSNLIDTPAASRLKAHRALFYSDETGETEKLRPYGPPSEEWLSSLSLGHAVGLEE